MAKLTDKMERFCQEYIVDLNATQAAIRAGYSEKTARSVASENLSKPDIQDKIALLKEKRALKVEITAEQVLRELKNWFFHDTTEFMDLSITEIKSLPIEIRRLISGYKIREKDGEQTFELSFVSKEKAAEMINRHVGFYEKDNSQKPAASMSGLSSADLKTILNIQSKIDK